MAGLSDFFGFGVPAAAGSADESNALRTARRLIFAGAAAVIILGAGLVNSALDSVRRIDAVAVQAEMGRAERALAALTVDGVLNGDDVRLLEQDYGFAGARLAETSSARNGEVMVTLRGASLDAPVHLAWTPRRFGSEMFSALAPRRIAMSALLTLIVGSVFFWLSRTARELDRHRRAAHELAIRDGLTGLANRRHFDATLRARLEAGTQAPCALVCLDLDDFKLVNDSMGHAAGDELLRSIGSRLQALAGPADLVARLGGDEFAVIRTSDVDDAGLAAFARSVILEICRPHRLRGAEVAVGVSIGIASAQVEGVDAGDLMQRADTALYRAKATSGPAFVFAGAEPAEPEIERRAA